MKSMDTKIWLETDGGFYYDGTTTAVIYSTYDDEPLAEVKIKFKYDRINDHENLTYTITEIYENTKETESELYDALNEQGHAILQQEICEWYEENFSPDWGI